ncbi:DNA-binding protein [Methylobacterium gossipiicola]|uniref:Replication region DNA-binding N-term n=1 Tax=Methylobacterium gossipiicola TaxID=582675 RepID=A0A1I2SZE9_9HYPH|nr:DNA-binding protein [Methylobacterium gossipiicola]SFG57940.1 replication region DNA-binding N-term [Methylobacterium gossipiicola]
MPTQDQVWNAADIVMARDEEPVRVATVLAELRRPTPPGEPPPVGGTERTVAPHLKTWKVARDYAPRPRVERLPERLQDDHAKFVRAVWAAATEEADARMEDERRTLAAETRANDALRVEAMVETDAARAEAAGLRAEAETLRAEAETLRAENATLRDQVGQLRGRLDHVRSEDYWEKVMGEAYEILPPEGTMSAGWILERLSRGTMRMGRFVKEPMDEATLRKKIEVRAKAARYFELRGKDAYARLPGWDGPLGRKVFKDDRKLSERNAPDVGEPP